jgi:hypothetical protein
MLSFQIMIAYSIQENFNVQWMNASVSMFEPIVNYPMSLWLIQIEWLTMKNVSKTDPIQL